MFTKHKPDIELEKKRDGVALLLIPTQEDILLFGQIQDIAMLYLNNGIKIAIQLRSSKSSGIWKSRDLSLCMCLLPTQQLFPVVLHLGLSNKMFCKKRTMEAENLI